MYGLVQTSVATHLSSFILKASGYIFGPVRGLWVEGVTLVVLVHFESRSEVI